MDYLWAIAFISAEKGLIYVKTYKDTLNHEKFGKIVEQVHVKMNKQPFTLFMDGAGYHKSKNLEDSFA